MKILLAFDSFKETLSSPQISKIVKEELMKKDQTLDIQSLEIGDGGEGSVNAIINAINAEKRYKTISGPHFEKIRAFIGIKYDSCFIESASVVGFKYHKNSDTPSNISTYGIGELIKYALDLNMRNIYVCLGGTTSNDGGCGMAAALGAKFINKDGNLFIPMGKSLNDISDIDLSALDKRLNDCNIYALCDVVNPLCGINGASYVYGPQKNASAEEVKIMDLGLNHLSELMKNKYNIDNKDLPSTGAAGGLGYGIISFLNGKIKKGIETILDLYNFNDIIRDVDIIFTGEGKLDNQSFSGKVIAGIIKYGEMYNKRIIGVFGIIDYDLNKLPECMKDVYETNINHNDFEYVKKHAEADLRNTIKRIKINEMIL